MTTNLQVKARFRPLCVLLVLVLGRAFAADPAPEVADILAQARLLQRSQHREFDGWLRNEGNKIPFRLILDGSLIRYEFTDGRAPLVLRLGARGTTLERAGDVVEGANLEDPIAGTDISYEDLSLKFLFWDLAKLEGEKIVLAGRKSWQISLLAPRGGDSQYGSVRVWVDKGSGALTRAEGYGRDGKLLKRFEVRQIQKLDDGSWALKQMRIQAMDGDRTRDSTPTYLELRD